MSAVSSRWRPAALALFHLAAAALFASWWYEPVRAVLWQPMDEALFHLLNGTLGQFGDTWSRFWAMANNRKFDLVAAVLMFGLYALYILGDGRRRMAPRMAELLFMLLLVAVTLAVVEETLMEIDRASPSLALGTDYRLSAMHPELKPKDASPASFPSDHGMVLLTWTGYLWLTAGPRFGLTALGLAVFFLLPRMVGGAHWLTDTLVGGLFIATLALAWAFCTPLQSWGVRALTPVMKPIAKLTDRLLGLIWK